MAPVYLIFFTLALSASYCHGRKSAMGEETGIVWDRTKLGASLNFLAAEAHPLGSLRQTQISEWLKAQAERLGLKASIDSFPVQVPDHTLSGTSTSVMQRTTLDKRANNIYAKFTVPDSSCAIMLGSHYDSKRSDDGLQVGANDSGSSSAALLEIMRVLASRNRMKCSVLVVWFDGEEAWLSNWNDGLMSHPARQQDNLYGSRHLASRLQNCASDLCLPSELGGEKLKALILLDMIGAPKLRLSRDSNSSPHLLDMALDIDQKVFAGQLYGGRYAKPIEDDHTPFLARGLPALDIIDFENLQHWHKASDTPDNVDLKSIEQASTLTVLLLEQLGSQP